MPVGVVDQVQLYIHHDRPVRARRKLKARDEGPARAEMSDALEFEGVQPLGPLRPMAREAAREVKHAVLLQPGSAARVFVGSSGSEEGQRVCPPLWAAGEDLTAGLDLEVDLAVSGQYG